MKRHISSTASSTISRSDWNTSATPLLPSNYYTVFGRIISISTVRIIIIVLSIYWCASTDVVATTSSSNNNIPPPFVLSQQQQSRQDTDYNNKKEHLRHDFIRAMRLIELQHPKTRTIRPSLQQKILSLATRVDGNNNQIDNVNVPDFMKIPRYPSATTTTNLRSTTSLLNDEAISEQTGQQQQENQQPQRKDGIDSHRTRKLYSYNSYYNSNNKYINSYYNYNKNNDDGGNDDTAAAVNDDGGDSSGGSNNDDMNNKDSFYDDYFAFVDDDSDSQQSYYRKAEYYGIDLTQYALKYVGCQNIHVWNNNSNAESLDTDRFVVFRLCESQSCSSYNTYGCNNEYGQYMLPLEQYLKIMAEYYYQDLNKYCNTCYSCMSYVDNDTDDMYECVQQEQSNNGYGNNIDDDAFNYIQDDATNDDTSAATSTDDGDNAAAASTDDSTGSGDDGDNSSSNDDDSQNNAVGYNQYNSWYYQQNNNNAGYNNYNGGGYSYKYGYNNNGYYNGNGYQYNYNYNSNNNNNGGYSNYYGGYNGNYGGGYNGNDGSRNLANNGDDDGSSNQCPDGYYRQKKDAPSYITDDGTCAYSSVCEDYQKACEDYQPNASYYEEFFSCSSFTVGNSVSYLGPHCRSDGHTIGIGIYSDDQCNNYVGDSVDISSYTGQVFDDTILQNYYDETCIACNWEQSFALVTDEDIGTSQTINPMCDALFSVSAKCNLYMSDISSTSDENDSASEQGVCNYIESAIKNQYDDSGDIILFSSSINAQEWTSLHSIWISMKQASILEFVALFVMVTTTLLLLLYSCYLQKKLIFRKPWVPPVRVAAGAMRRPSSPLNNYLNPSGSDIGFDSDLKSEAGWFARINSGIVLTRTDSLGGSVGPLGVAAATAVAGTPVPYVPYGGSIPPSSKSKTKSSNMLPQLIQTNSNNSTNSPKLQPPGVHASSKDGSKGKNSMGVFA